MINWVFFPKSKEPSKLARDIVKVFNESFDKIDSDKHHLSSNGSFIKCFGRAGKNWFSGRKTMGKKKQEKIFVPVLYGQKTPQLKNISKQMPSSRRRDLFLKLKLGEVLQIINF